MAAAVSGAIVYLLLRAVDIAQQLGIPANLPPSILSLVGAGAVFTALYWILDRYAWQWPVISRLLKVPNLSGEWHCRGQTLNTDKTVAYDWSGTLTVLQSWDRLRVRLKTETSGSNSISAALICDSIDGYRLFYSYRNDPRIGEPELVSHRGFAEITFDKELASATGEYFNGYGRYTFGKMHLTRNERDGA